LTGISMFIVMHIIINNHTHICTPQ
jgi:hypothetical protein